jgi:hypothetical protein
MADRLSSPLAGEVARSAGGEVQVVTECPTLQANYDCPQ